VSESRLREIFREAETCVVALSGGVDSSVLAAVAREELGEGAVAVTGVSPSLSSVEREEILVFVKDRGLVHVEVDTHELEHDDYLKNDPDRCFHCKSELYAQLRTVADARGIERIFDGTHAEDLAGHRPGKRAADEAGVRSPFVEAGMGKEDVRNIARALGLSNAERPSQPCLSSRIAYGVEVTPERLTRVGRAEQALKAMGFERVRVRLHGEIARVELPKKRLAEAIERREEISRACKDAGFVYVTVDLEGLRSGSLLEVFQ
jgi:uncharacterized protein